MNFTRSILTLSVALACGGVVAADYYVVIPVQGRVANVADITVSLSPASLTGIVGQAYRHDLNTHLQVTGDPSFNGTGVSWALLGGSLPAGLTLDTSTGVVSGTPTVNGASSFQLQAAYRSQSGQQSYSLAIQLLRSRWAATALSFGDVGLYGDGTVTATLYNDGEALGHWTSMANLGSGVTADASGCANVPAGGSCPVVFHFTPSALGSVSLSGIAPAGVSNPGNTLSLTGTGVQRVVSVSPAVNGKTSWNLEVDGPLALAQAGTWTITPETAMGWTTKLWGAGGGGGGADGASVYSGKGGGGAYVGGLYQVATNTPVTATVGGGGLGGASGVLGLGGGAGGSNGGGSGGHAGPVGVSGGGGGGGGRTELLQGPIQVACAGGGGGGGGDGYLATNGNNNGNYATGYTATKTGASALNRTDDGGGNGGGGGGCNGGAASTNYPFKDSNGEGGSAGQSTAPGLKNVTITAAGTDALPANASDGDLSPGYAEGGVNSSTLAPGGTGRPGKLVIR